MRTKKDGTEVMSLADHIWNVLEANEANGNEFMNESAIAIDVMANVRGRPQDKTLYGRVIQPKSIKSCMGSVRAIADLNGATIVAERKFHDEKGTALKGWIILGWRIASDEDEDYITHELSIRATMESGVSKMRRKLGRSDAPALEE